MIKSEIISNLKELGIPHDPTDTVKALTELLPVVPKAPAAGSSDGIEVGDPMLLRPVELPLVVKPTSGAWANPEQEKYAAVLNAYAYRNPKKWEKKKTKLIKQLSDLATTPEDIHVLNGGVDLMLGQITYTDKRLA